MKKLLLAVVLSLVITISAVAGSFEKLADVPNGLEIIKIREYLNGTILIDGKKDGKIKLYKIVDGKFVVLADAPLGHSIERLFVFDDGVILCVTNTEDNVRELYEIVS